MRLLNWLEEKILGFLWRRCIKRKENEISKNIRQMVDEEIWRKLNDNR